MANNVKSLVIDLPGSIKYDWATRFKDKRFYKTPDAKWLLSRIKSSIDCSNSKVPIFRELEPFAMDLETGKFYNFSSDKKLVCVGYEDKQEYINSHKDSVDIYSLLDKVRRTGDFSLVNQKVGTFMDIGGLPEDIHELVNLVQATNTQDLKSKLEALKTATPTESIDIQKSINEAVAKAFAEFNKTTGEVIENESVK